MNKETKCKRKCKFRVITVIFLTYVFYTFYLQIIDFFMLYLPQERFIIINNMNDSDILKIFFNI